MSLSRAHGLNASRLGRLGLSTKAKSGRLRSGARKEGRGARSRVAFIPPSSKPSGSSCCDFQGTSVVLDNRHQMGNLEPESLDTRSFARGGEKNQRNESL